MCPIKAVLFDFDGTLWDPESCLFRLYSEELEKDGFVLDFALWRTVIGASETDLWAGLERRFGVMDKHALRARIDSQKSKILSNITTRPGVIPLLTAIDELKLPRGIVSNSSDDWVEHYSRQCGIAHGWTAVECANGNATRAKPNPHLYSEAVRRIGVDPSMVIAFEDSPRGIQAARQAGVVCIVIPNEMTAGLDLSGADIRFDSFEQVNPALLLQV